MIIPKIKKAKAVDEHTLLVEFDNQKIKTYDVTNLLKNGRYEFLKNPIFFKAVQVERGGYAVYWNEDVDISEFELWNNGEDFLEE